MTPEEKFEKMYDMMHDIKNDVTYIKTKLDAHIKEDEVREKNIGDRISNIQQQVDTTWKMTKMGAMLGAVLSLSVGYFGGWFK